MAIFTIPEFLDVIIMSACIGYIFSGYFSKFNKFKKPDQYGIIHKNRFSWHDFYFSICLIGPAILLHELGHKFVAMAFGFNATFYSAISINKIIHGMPFFDFASILMIIAIIMTYFGSSFLFFVPAYVDFGATATALQQTLIAFAGPFVNLVLWLGSAWIIKNKKLSQKYYIFLMLTSKINMVLFIFNMLPIPGFDGFKVYSGLFSLLF